MIVEPAPLSHSKNTLPIHQNMANIACFSLSDALLLIKIREKTVPKK
jgi:hypothetical protein